MKIKFIALLDVQIAKAAVNNNGNALRYCPESIQTARGILRFINTWLARAQDGSNNQPGNSNGKHRVSYDVIASDDW